jgi:hypothetical protein
MNPFQKNFLTAEWFKEYVGKREVVDAVRIDKNAFS